MLKGKTKVTVLCAVAAFIIGAAVLTTSAVTDNLHKEKENDFVPAVISLAVVENNEENSDSKLKKQLEWKSDNENYKADKKVEIANLNNKDENNTSAYIRVCINPRWTAEVTVNAGTAEESKVMVDADMPLDDFGALTAIEINQESNSYTMGAVTFHLAADWNEHWFYNDKDGYFYCKSVISIGKKTPPLLDYVTISSDTKQKLKSLGAKLTVDVLADGIQSEGKAANTMWTNVKINSDRKLEKNE